MSRAVLRKRKRLSKLQLSSVGKDANIGLLSAGSDGESEPSGDDASEEHDAYDLNDIEGDVTNESETLLSNIAEKYDVADVSLLDILHLRDVEDVTAVEKGMLLLSKLFHPTPCVDVLGKYWEKRALACQYGNPQHVKKLISRKTLEGTVTKQLLFENTNIAFFRQRDLAVTSRKLNDESEGGGEEPDRELNDAESDEDEQRREVRNAEVWQKFHAGYTVRLLTPQMYHDGVWKLLSALEHVFNCRVSAEAVLTPLAGPAAKTSTKSDKPSKDGAASGGPGAVAFDNANAIIVQLEGHSRWRASPNPHSHQQLALQSGAVPLKDIDEWRKPDIDVTLGPGGTLYIPKGWVYQQDNNGSSENGAGAGSIDGDGHSLHLKVCCNHGTTATVADLLEVVMPQALAEAVQSRVELRAALPRTYAGHLGVARSEVEGDAQRERLLAKISSLMRLVTEKAMDILDPAADQVYRAMELKLNVDVSNSICFLEYTRSL
jgi:hypothetical protein